jgi:nucleoside-diphosphate-sugar epimerase
MTEGAVQFDYQPPNEDPNDIHWKYARGKLEAERECAKQRKVPWTILRPPVVYGPNDPNEGGFWYLARLLQGGPVLLGDGGTQSFRLLSSADTARAFVKVVEVRKKTLRKIYFLGQGEIITLRDFVEESARAMGIIPEFLSVPTSVLGEMAGPYANMVNLIPDISAARKDFGFETTPFPEFARQAAEWFRDNWEGESSKLLTDRSNEIAFGANWKKRMSSL